jgi:hypothetical protein
MSRYEPSNTNEIAALKADTAQVVNVKDFGATPDSLLDQTPYIQAAVDYLISIGGGVLWFPNGEYRIIADTNTTTSPYNPKRVLISGTITGTVGPPDTRVVHYVENIHIRGDKNATIYMTGMTYDFLYAQDDIALGNVDIFCAFTFRYANNCSIANIKITGDYLEQGTDFRYDGVVSQARAKAISFFGCTDCEVHDVDARYILGNFVHVNTASSTLDGYWHPSEGIDIYDNHFDTCLEIGIDLTTTVSRARVMNNTTLHCNGAGIEGPAIISGNTVKNCYGGGISPSGDSIVVNNVIEDVRDAFILAASADITNAQQINTMISNNIVKNARRRFLYVYGGSGNLIFTGNRCINSNVENDTTVTYGLMVYLAGSVAKPIESVTITDNYFEIMDSDCFTNYGIYAICLEDSFINNNTFISAKTLTADMYFSDPKGVVVENNKLTTTIAYSSTAKDRNTFRNNNLPNSNLAITTDWTQSLPPDSGVWKVGDVLKIVPVLTPKGSQYNLETGYECVSISPLTWRKKVSAETGEWSNAVPASGTWSKGRLAHSTVPIVGGNTGWICTA